MFIIRGLLIFVALMSAIVPVAHAKDCQLKQYASPDLVAGGLYEQV
jgi:hypothetical protein